MGHDNIQPDLISEIKFNHYYIIPCLSKILAELDKFLFLEEIPNEISIIINAYIKLGFKLNLSDFIEITAQEPIIKSSLNIVLDFWKILESLSDNAMNLNLIESSILKFSTALAVVVKLNDIINIPLFKKITELSLIYIQFLLISKAKDQVKITELCSSLIISSLITQDLKFINLVEDLKSSNFNNIFAALIQCSLNIGMEVSVILEQENIITQSLLQLLILLSIKLQDLSIKILSNKQHIPLIWQNLIEQFIEIAIKAEHKLSSKLSNKTDFLKVHNLKKENNQANSPLDLKTDKKTRTIYIAESLPAVDSIRTDRAKLIQTLNDHNHFAAASELEDLSTEIAKLDLQYTQLIKATKQKITLPVIVDNDFLKNKCLEQKITATDKFPTVEFKLVKTCNNRLRLSISWSNSELLYLPWYTEVPLELCPRDLDIPRFKGRLALTKAGDLKIKYLPEEFNYNFKISTNLYIDKLVVNGRFKAIVQGVIANHAVSIATGGFVLLAQEVNNINGKLITFNVPTSKLNKLFKHLATYRRLTTLLAKPMKDLANHQGIKEKSIRTLSQNKLDEIKFWFKAQNIDLAYGKIYVQTNNLHNYNGSILSGGSCILRSTKLDLRKGVIASHSNKVDLLNLGDHSNLNCINNSMIWAFTTLQAKASKIIKDDTSLVEGLKSTTLRSFEGNLRSDGSIVGATVNLIQDCGYYYQANNVKAHNLTVITGTTSNLLEKKLHVDLLRVVVINPNSYLADLTVSLFVSKKINLSLPGIRVCKEISAGKAVIINAPIYQLDKSQNYNLYTVNLQAKIIAPQVIILGHGVKQNVNSYNDSIIKSDNLTIISSNLNLPVGFKVKANALLHATGFINYSAEKLQAGQWLSLHFSKVSNFKFAKKIPGSLYVKVLADNAPIILSKDLTVKKHVVVAAPDSSFSSMNLMSTINSNQAKTGKIIKLHAGEEGNILLQVKEFRLTTEGLFAGLGITILVNGNIKFGLKDIPDPKLEPYIFSNGYLTISSTDEAIELLHGNITALKDGLLQGQIISHTGINLLVGVNNGGLSYIGQPVVAHLSERTCYPKSPEFIKILPSALYKKGYHYTKVYRNYRNWERIISRRNTIKISGKLSIENNRVFIGSGYIDLEVGSYSGNLHLLDGKLTATVFNSFELHEVLCRDYVLGDSLNKSHNWLKRLIYPKYNCENFKDYEYEYDTIKPFLSSYGNLRIIVSKPLQLEYNLVADELNLDLANNQLIVGSKLKDFPLASQLTLSKIVSSGVEHSYIHKELGVNNIVIFKPIFPIGFTRPQIKIVILYNFTNYIIANPNDYPLNHPFLEMQDLIRTIKTQLGHHKISTTGLSDKEIYYYMIANALEHAKNNLAFTEDSIIKPMLVYRENLDRSIQPISLLPKILDLPELRSNIGGIFCRLLTAKGNAGSSLELLGIIVAQEGGKIDVGRLTIMQQYRETSKVLITTTKKRNLICSKTKISGKISTQLDPIANTAKLIATTGSWEINLINFYARGGTIVCLGGDLTIRVKNLVDLHGLLGNYYIPHYSTARTLISKISTNCMVKREYIIPFKLSIPGGAVIVLCNGEIYAEALEVLANHGYIKGEKVIELESSKLWQEIGPSHTKRGMILSSSWGKIQTASPCRFTIENEMIFETAEDGSYKDTGSEVITGKTVTIRAGRIEIKPVELQRKIYTKSSGLIGFLYVRSNSREQHLVHKGAVYAARIGDVVFHATSKDIIGCALTASVPQGGLHFISDKGKVYLSQAYDQHHIATTTKSIGLSFRMSDAILQAIRRDFSKAIQASLGELQVVKDIKGLLDAEGTITSAVKGISAANSIVKSLLDLHEGGIIGFVAGNLNKQVKLTFSREHKIVDFSEIMGNWLLAKEIIVNAQQDLILEATQVECNDLNLTAATGCIKIAGGTASCVSSTSSRGINLGIQGQGQGRFPILEAQRSKKIQQALTYGISHFKVTGETYLSALQGEVAFRNAILEARKAYIEALSLTLESQRDEILEKAKASSIGTNVNFNKSKLNSKWVQQQTGIKVSRDLNIAIEQATNLIGAYIEVGAEATPLLASYFGETTELYELLLPKDLSELGFKILGIPRATAVFQLFEKADDIDYRRILAPEIIQKLLNKELPEFMHPLERINIMTREEMLEWASTKECYENYLGFYLGVESTPLSLNQHANIGAMAAIAKLNKLQLRIWGKTVDQQLYWSINHNETGIAIINIAVDNAGNYTRLSETPGILISPTFSYSDVESSYNYKEVGLSLEQLVFGEMVAGIKLSDITKRQINFAHLSSNIKLKSNDDVPSSTIKQSGLEVETVQMEIDSDLIKKVSDLAAGISKLRDVLRQHDPKLQRAMELEENSRIMEEQKQLSDKFKSKKAPKKSKSALLIQPSEEVTKIIDRYDLAATGEITLKQKLFLRIKQQLQVQALIASENGRSFDLNQAISYAKSKVSSSSMEEIQTIQKMYDYSIWLNNQSQIRRFNLTSTDCPESTATTTNHQNIDLDPENIEIMGHAATGEIFARILAGSMQAGVNVVKKIPSAYTSWSDEQDQRLEELKECYGHEALDFEAYLYRQQAELLMKHTTIGKSRKNFDPGNVVNDNSISIGLDSVKCKIESTIIFSNMRDGIVGGGVIGGMTGAIPGAMSGALSGLVTGAVVGAFNAKKELENCTLAAQAKSDATKTSNHITSNVRDFAIVETIANGMSGGNIISGIIPGITAGALVGLVNAAIDRNVRQQNNITASIPSVSSSNEGISEGSLCKLNSSLIFSNMRDFTIGGTVIGGMTGALPGAVTGALTGSIGGALVGAFQANNEQKKCKKLISE